MGLLLPLKKWKYRKLAHAQVEFIFNPMNLQLYYFTTQIYLMQMK